MQLVNRVALWIRSIRFTAAYILENICKYSYLKESRVLTNAMSAGEIMHQGKYCLTFVGPASFVSK